MNSMETITGMPGADLVPVVVDFESYFCSKTFTLKKLTTEEYIRDSRFAAHGASIWFPMSQAYPMWVDNHQLPAVFAKIPWERVALLAHHTHFDGLILAHHYGVVPGFYLDTLGMARPIVGALVSKSLESLALLFNLLPKQVPYALFDGKYWHELADPVKTYLVDAFCHDSQLCWDIFKKLIVQFPKPELLVIDTTIRMFTQPKLKGNLDVFDRIWRAERAKKERLLAELGLVGQSLSSNDKFRDLLEREGVDVEYKAGTNGPIPAFAKSDFFMQDLLEHPNDRVRTLAEARLALKSTLEQRRVERLGSMANRGRLAVYLNYCGAHTTRWSGGDRLNWQNTRRDGLVEDGIECDDDCLIIRPDLEQIECRVLNYLAGQDDVIEKFRLGIDPYIDIASKFYGFPVTKRDHPKERGTGKQLELSCGYGAGASTIQKTARLGTYGPPVILSLDDAERAKRLYRGDHRAVVALWAHAGELIHHLFSGSALTWRGFLHVKDHKIWLPNGLPLHYETLEWQESVHPGTGKFTKEWRLKRRSGYTKLYGGKLVENVVQALARVIVSDAMICLRVLGYHFLTTKHDDVAILVQRDRLQQCVADVRREMTKPPWWMPDLPLGIDVHVGPTLACKFKPEDYDHAGHQKDHARIQERQAAVRV